MIIRPDDAKQFLATYSRLLTEAYRLTDGEHLEEMLAILAAGRDAIVAEPLLIDAVVTNLEDEGVLLAPDALAAIRTLQLQEWVFLRDTTKYSIFIDVDGKEAYAVRGLTDRLSDITRGTGLLVRTGLVYYKGGYVCDGILANPVWLGPEYKRSYAEIFTALKQSGHFHTE